MSNSRSSQKNKDSKQNVFVNSSDDSTPDSPAVKVKKRENQDNPDPLYYHPNAHPTLSTFFRQKSREMENELRASAELAAEDIAVKKAGI